MQEFPSNVRNGDTITVEFKASVLDQDSSEGEWAIGSMKLLHNKQVVKVNREHYKDLALQLLALHVGFPDEQGDSEHARRTELVRVSVDSLLWGLSSAAFTPTRQWIIDKMRKAQRAGGDEMVTVYIPHGADPNAGKRELQALLDEGLVEGQVGVSATPIRFTHKGWENSR